MVVGHLRHTLPRMMRSECKNHEEKIGTQAMNIRRISALLYPFRVLDSFAQNASREQSNTVILGKVTTDKTVAEQLG